MKPQRIVLDTDPGIDDALTILLALASPELELAALTVVHGNCPLADATRNALNMLHLVQAAHIPVAAGASVPLLQAPITALETHGDRGLGNATLEPALATPVAEHAVTLLIREILAAPGEVTLVAIGPLTNIALALRIEPRLAQAVRQVIIMGGALDVPGNVTPLAEFNIYADPHAAQIVLRSGMPIIVMPWDITREVLLTQEDITRLQRTPGPIPPVIAALTSHYIEFHRIHLGYAGCSVNDPAALALAIQPDLAQLTPMTVAVEVSSALTMGKTVALLPDSAHPPNVQVVTHFDRARFLAFFLERMEQLAARLAHLA